MLSQRRSKPNRWITKGKGKNAKHIPIRKPYGEPREKAARKVEKIRREGLRARLIETNRKHKLYAPYESKLNEGSYKRKIYNELKKEFEDKLAVKRVSREDLRPSTRAHRTLPFSPQTRDLFDYYIGTGANAITLRAFATFLNEVKILYPNVELREVLDEVDFKSIREAAAKKGKHVNEAFAEALTELERHSIEGTGKRAVSNIDTSTAKIMDEDIKKRQMKEEIYTELLTQNLGDLNEDLKDNNTEDIKMRKEWLKRIYNIKDESELHEAIQDPNLWVMTHVEVE